MLTKSFLSELSVVLSLKLGGDVEINSVIPVSGGSINEAARLNTSQGNFFIKWDSASRFPGMFDAEVKGINILSATNAVSLPAIIIFGEIENISFLILEMISPGTRSTNYNKCLGEDLAMLHKITSDEFGLNHNNYIGSLSQSNKQYISGVEFMMGERFEPLIKSAFEKLFLDNSHLHLAEQLYKNLVDFLPEEKPSLLHGDLWNGNIILGANGKAWLIDPSVYFGYRETDLAMTRLFGGFDEEFYTAYNEFFPLQPGWENRIALFQLYPLLVHLNLFGSSYRGSVINILNRYS